VPKLVETRICSECGTTIFTYDPPITFEVSEGCAAINPISKQVCNLILGHTGKHYALVEEVESWE
jgi:hypothetical protein